MNHDANRFDIAVLGGGPGGYVAAIRASQLGKRAVLIEREKIGGTCLHWGCIPTKALLQNAEVYRHCLESESFGIETGQVSFDWDAITQRRRGIVERLHKGVQFLMKKNNIEVRHGSGRLVSPTSIVVEGERSAETLEVDHIILATGSVAKSLPGVEIDEERVISNIGALTLKEPPASMTVIGAGAVGVEFASIYRTFGTDVTILEYMPRLVPLEDEEVSKQLLRSFRKARIQVQTGVAVQAVENLGDRIRTTFKKNDKEETTESEICLVAVGRQAVTEGIGLENTRVRTNRGVVVVDEYCRTDEPSVYAIGDLIGNYQLAHVAEVEGVLAASHVCGREAEPIDYSAVPRCTYCQPQIGSVGLSEAEAKEKGIPIEVGTFQFQANGKALAMGNTEGFSKIIRHAETGEILGGHIVGPEATELVMELVVAKRHKMTVRDLARTIHAHPTLSEVTLEALHAALGEPLQG